MRAPGTSCLASAIHDFALTFHPRTCTSVLHSPILPQHRLHAPRAGNNQEKEQETLPRYEWSSYLELAERAIHCRVQLGQLAFVRQAVPFLARTAEEQRPVFQCQASEDKEEGT